MGDILTESKIVSEYPNPDRRITVRLKVLGVEKRGLENEVEGATKQYIRKAGQFIYGKQNFHKGAFGIVPPELDGFESSSDLPAFDVDKTCLPEFIFYFFKQGNFYLELSKIASGVATQRINTTQFFELELLLPDIKTQRQLISNIQILESKGSELSIELTHQLTLVKKLRQQLLHDAVQGKLVEQNATDEAASELLKKIKAEKAKLISEKKLKKEKELPPIKLEEIPFKIPKNWVWCCFAEIVVIESNLVSPFNFPNSPHIAPDNIEKNTGRLLKYITVLEDNVQSANHYFYSGQLIYSKVRPKLNKVVKVDFEGLCSADMYPLRPLVNTDYIQQCMLSTYFLNEVDRFDNRVKMPKINQNQLSQIPIPLPPLAEQNRIVYKLNELMQHCNELEASIKKSESQNEKLLQQVLREALRKEPVEE
ncbi:MAG: restriction endonuclease subunit S [Saprospiraceae bacterium]